MTRAVILDLERRGFVVYVVASSQAEEHIIKSERKPDVLPLHLDVSDVRRHCFHANKTKLTQQKPVDVESTINHFTRTLNTQQHAHPGSSPHSLSLTGIVLIPDTTYPTGPVETVSPELWADAINAKVLGTIATTQAFIRPAVAWSARIVIATPGIVPALRPPFQAVQSSVTGALEGFIDSLRSELATVGVHVCQLRLGSFDLASSGAANSQPLSRQLGNEVLGWPSHAREAYQENFLAQHGRAERSGNRGFWFGLGRGASGRGSPLRELNNAVFDSLSSSWPADAQRVGQGSSIYAAVGTLAPASLVRWMMGMRSTGRRRLSDTWETVEK